MPIYQMVPTCPHLLSPSGPNKQSRVFSCRVCSNQKRVPRTCKCAPGQGRVQRARSLQHLLANRRKDVHVTRNFGISLHSDLRHLYFFKFKCNVFREDSQLWELWALKEGDCDNLTLSCPNRQRFQVGCLPSLPQIHGVFEGAPPRGRQLYFTLASVADPLLKRQKHPFLP